MCLTEDIHLYRGMNCRSGEVYFPPSALRMVPLLLRKEARGGGKAATSNCFVSFGHEAGAFRSPPPPLRPLIYKLVSYPPLADRGGSVSRRDHNLLARNRAQLTGGTKPAEAPNPIASCSSGEGVWGRGASLREAASPPESPNPNSLFGRERAGGGFSTEKPPPAQNLIRPRSLSRTARWCGRRRTCRRRRRS